MRCRSCCDKIKNYVIVKIIDEDDDIDSWATAFKNAMFENGLDTSKTIFTESAQYLNDLHGEDGVSGYLGFILVPVFNDGGFAQAHLRMLERFQEFYDSLEGVAKERTIILDTVQRENNYSQQLISAIESLRENSENPEEPLPLDYIITFIDNSGSHDIRDFGPSFIDYYTQYSSEENNQAIQELLEFEFNPGILLRELISGRFVDYGLNRGIGTKHIIVSGFSESISENWLTEILYSTFKIAADLTNDWEINCEKICKYRWTTYNNLYLIPFFPSFLNTTIDILDYVSSEDLEPNLNLYDFVYRSDSDRRKFDIRSSWPGSDPYAPSTPFFWDSVKDKFPNNPFAEFGTYNGQAYGLRESLDELTSGAQSLGLQSCPCWMFDPVKNYVKIISE